jgi:hypothetical protein
MRGKEVAKETCPHPLSRLWSWFAEDCLGRTLVVCCCDCGGVLRGAAPTPKGADRVMRQRARRLDPAPRPPS